MTDVNEKAVFDTFFSELLNLFDYVIDEMGHRYHEIVDNGFINFSAISLEPRDPIVLF